MASSDPGRRDEEEGAHAGEDEDFGAQFAPIVKLEEVAVTTGEEDEEVILDLKAKLYRFNKEGNQWKERGVGMVKLLKHKENGKVRLVMRQAKTLKICANHLVLPSISIQEHVGNDKSCVWHASDFSDGEVKEELFCMRFGSTENCRHFMEMVEEIAKSQETEGEDREATSAADLIEKLSVGESQTEVRKEENDVPVAAAEKKETESNQSKAEVKKEVASETESNQSKAEGKKEEESSEA